MRRALSLAAGLVIVGVIAGGCVTTKGDRATSLKTSKAPAWSLKANQDEMIVAVSPVRQSVQILGSSAAILGAGIDAIANDRHRKAIREALTGYDAGKVFEERIQKRLVEATPNLKRVAPVGSTAGKQSLDEVQKERYAKLAKGGADTLLDVKMTYGLFGYEGLLVTKLEGTLKLVPEGRELWGDTIVVSAEPILAHDKLSDPTNTLGPNLSSPRLSADDNAISKWTGDGGKTVRARFEASVDGVVSALLCDLGVAHEASGEYYLGKMAMNRKRFEDANVYFENALKLDPNYVDAENGRAVNLAHNKQVDKAIELARGITVAHPDYGPAWFNLAWWYATDKKDAAQAKECYEKARALGMPEESRIEKAAGK
ncbi:MAG: tetratricopeptide repeat protein [Candidatus Hydrogenedentes bacterium]|nr:tetratricopeptide repeat protein [Candidatus Hydrogenedentota bacterium]